MPKCPNNFKIPFAPGLSSGVTVCSRFPVPGAVEAGRDGGEKRKRGHHLRWYHLKKTARTRCWGRSLN